MIPAVPLALLLMVLILFRSLLRPKIAIHILATEGEFGPLIQLMEQLRSCGFDDNFAHTLFVLSKKRHKTLSDMYRKELDVRIVWSSGMNGILQQALLLQPNAFVRIERLTSHDSHGLGAEFLEPAAYLNLRRRALLEEIDVHQKRYVTMAVHTAQYDAENNPEYQTKEASLESIGREFGEVIDFLQDNDVAVILLGAPDTGRSAIPREIPRLASFGVHGGEEEVALASGCLYFWTDNVGAWWLTAPFGRPVLFTNEARCRRRAGAVLPNHLFVPARYVTPGGYELTLRDVLQRDGSPYKAASLGELTIVRNSSIELTEAHLEMIARVEGTWTEDDQGGELQARANRLFAEFREVHPIRISSMFLARHPQLLE